MQERTAFLPDVEEIQDHGGSPSRHVLPVGEGPRPTTAAPGLLVSSSDPPGIVDTIGSGRVAKIPTREATRPPSSTSSSQDGVDQLPAESHHSLRPRTRPMSPSGSLFSTGGPRQDGRPLPHPEGDAPHRDLFRISVGFPKISISLGGWGRGGTSIRAANRTRRPRTGDMYSARNAIAPRNAGLCATGRCIRRNTRKTAVRVVAHEDDDVLPILRLPKKETDVPNPTTKEQRGTVGATTVGEELARIHGQMKNRDTSVKDRMEAELNTPNWDGDVYIGSNWNVGTALLLVFVVTMVGIGVFAYLTYGTVWGTTPDVQF